jgi:predicted RNase H-like HicB family nuclease
MRTVRVIYHDDPDGWWAISPEVPGYTAFGETYAEVRDKMVEGLPWYAEEDDLIMAHIVPSEAGQPTPTGGAKVSFSMTGPSLKPRYFARAEPSFKS